MASPDRQSFRAIALVTVVAVIAAALVSGSHEISRERIAENQRARVLRGLGEVLDRESHDNDLLRDRILVSNPELLGGPEPTTVYLASRNGEPVAAIFASRAPLGYNGPIELLVGITMDGTITGVRVTAHRETPGLGDKIEIGKSDWITGFDGTSLTAPTASAWTMTSDGGHYDAFTGATVTPRAVVDSVKNTLLFFQQNGDELFVRLALSQADPDALGRVP